jgi:hypothetical protein
VCQLKGALEAYALVTDSLSRRHQAGYGRLYRCTFTHRFDGEGRGDGDRHLGRSPGGRLDLRREGEQGAIYRTGDEPRPDQWLVGLFVGAANRTDMEMPMARLSPRGKCLS